MVVKHNLSQQRRFEQIGHMHQPEFHFSGSTPEDWRQWRSTLLPHLIDALGDMPQRVPLNLEVFAEWTEDGLHKCKLVFWPAPFKLIQFEVP